MPASKDDGVPPIYDEDSAAETEIFVGSVSRAGAAKRASTPRQRPVDAATVRELPPPPSAAAKPAPAPTPAPKPAPAPALKPALGQTVSLVRAPLDEQGFGARYLPTGVLGEGGMGIIGLCKDVRIGREVAMKMLLKEKLGSADARMRFEREARVQGQLEHPAIVPVYDLGVRPDGRPFFTMKRLHGETLAVIMDALQKGSTTVAAAYPQRRLLGAFSRVCQAVAFANSRGVLHRDLKPSNIMLGDFGEVYLLDWGLAKLMDAEDPDDAIAPASTQRDTQVGEVMGSPGYMSPEQLRGEIDQLDARTDVYTLGVLLFELTTLEPLHPRKGLDTIYNSTLGKLDNHLSERARARGVPPELIAVSMRATALDPRDRYPSARDVYEAIERFLDGHRDVRQREDMAAGHAKTGMEAAALAATMPEMRELAVRELGAALALDPSHAGAVEALTRLMLEAPPKLSDEARRAFASSRRGTYRESKRGVLASYSLWVCFFPVVVALGVRDRAAAAITGGSVALAALVSWLTPQSRLGGPARFLMYCLGTLAIASSCTLMGWAIVVPGLAAVHTVGFILYGDRKFQPAALALGALAVIVPFVLQEAGWIQRAYLFEGDRMIVLPRMTGLPVVRTQIYLLLASLAAIVGPSVLISRLRASLEAAEERAFMQAWTMQNLVPERAREAAAALRKGEPGKGG
jgi:eukaryotic-like serine/threonine-protein kinase